MDVEGNTREGVFSPYFTDWRLKLLNQELICLVKSHQPGNVQVDTETRAA
jgi:hypothetical protein